MTNYPKGDDQSRDQFSFSSISDNVLETVQDVDTTEDYYKIPLSVEQHHNDVK